MPILKTTQKLFLLIKFEVSAGGAKNHRLSLEDIQL
jgi:nicotinate-nucleotide pyrophosphorylase